MGIKERLRQAGGILLLLLIATAVSGCDEIEKYVGGIVAKIESQKSSDKDKEIAVLKSEIASLKQTSAKLRQDLDGLSFGQDLLRMGVDSVWDSAATIAEGGTYSVARTFHGPVIISMERIEPYLDGYKVTLSIGNPTTVTFNDASIDIGWGLPWSNKSVPYEQIRQSQKKKTFSALKSFQSGAYTLVDVTLTPAKAEEVKELSVGIKWNKIYLRKAAQ